MDSRALIMFDGPDGCGKTTQLGLVAQALKQQGRQVFTAHMLGGSPVGEAIHDIMSADMDRPALTNFHLSLAAYYALLEVVHEKLAAGYTVLIDRSPLSLVAYQVFGDKLDEATGFTACSEALQTFQPMAVIIYTAPPEMLQSRRQQRGETPDYFEKLPADYHARTIDGFTAAAKRYASVIIDAEPPVEAVHEQTMRIVNGLLGV